MKKTKCIKSIIGIGAIGTIGLGVSASIASCGKATDVVSFDSAYKPSVSTTDGEQTYHASSSMAGKISYTTSDLPSGVTFNSGKLNYTIPLPTNHDITINATSDKGGHSSIRITLLASALSATITANTLQLGTSGTATLSVTEINTSDWANPTISFGDATSSFTYDSWADSGLTRTTIIHLNPSSLPDAGSHTVTVSLNGATAVQTFAVEKAQALKFNFSSDHPGQVNRVAEYDSHIDMDNFTVKNQNGENLAITTGEEVDIVKVTGKFAYTSGTNVEPSGWNTLPDAITIGSNDKVGSIVCNDQLTRDSTYDGKIIWVRLTATLDGYALAEYDWKLEIQAHPQVFLEVNPTTVNSELADYFAITNGTLTRKKDNAKDDEFILKLQSGTWDVDGKIPNALRISDVSSIASETFYNCAYLKNSTAPINTLQFVPSSSSYTLSIDSYAFLSCTGLRRVEFDTSSNNATVSSIATRAFDGCANLTGLWKTSSNNHLYLSSSIGVDAFRGCARLSIDAIDAIEFSEDNQDLDKVVNKNADETAILGIGILNKTWTQSNSCMITGDMGNKLNTYAIKDNSIGSYVFDGCASLTSIDLSNCLATTIDSAAFIGCTNLTSITLPSSLASIPNNEYGPFRNCTNLTTLKLPYAMFAIGNNASIADEAFYNCPTIHEIYIPADAVAEFKNGSAAFNGCKTNGTIWYPAGKQDIATDFIGKFTALANWTLSQIP